MGNNKTAMIRRFIAIGLTLLAILFMFLPAIAAVDSDHYDDAVEEWKEWKEYKKDHSKSEMIKDATESYKDYYDMSTSDAKRMANAAYTANNIESRPNFSLAQLRTYFSALTTEFTLIEKNGSISFLDSDYVGFVVAMAILLNLTFWPMLIFGIGAMVLYFFNKTRALGVVFAVFAFLNALVVIIFLAVSKSKEGSITAPGAMMFLMPMFALASCIVYQRSKPAKKGRLAAQPMNNQWTQPQANNQWAQQPAEAVWTCPVCGGKNPVTAGFCANCGTKQPAKQTDWFCPVCGSKNPVTAGFCANCGTKQP